MIVIITLMMLMSIAIIKKVKAITDEIWIEKGLKELDGYKYHNEKRKISLDIYLIIYDVSWI